VKLLTGMNDSALDYASGYAFIGFAILSVGFIVLSFIAKLVIVQRLHPNDNQLKSPA